MAQINSRIITRNDTIANWETNGSVVLMKGEQAVAFFEDGTIRMKIGDGVTEWKDQEWFDGNAESAAEQIYEAEKQEGETDEAAIARVVGENTLHAGDMAVVKTLLAEGKYSHTGYVYNGSAWAAMDGNYNAENVYFDEDMLFTYKFGKYELVNGNVTIPSAGKNLKELQMSAHVDIVDPVSKAPTFSVSASSDISQEVGTTYTLPSASATMKDGTYTYGYVDENGVKTNGTNTSAGITATSIVLSCDKSSDETTVTNVNTGSLAVTEDNLTDESLKGRVVTDDSIVYTFTGECAYPASKRTPTNNVGETSNSDTGVAYEPIGEGEWTVEDGTAKTDTCTVSGWRKMFIGTVGAEQAAAAIDSAMIRGLGLVSKQVSKTAQTFTVPVGAVKIIVAYPADYTSSEPKFEYFTMSWESAPGFVKGDNVEVADYRGGENGLKEYTVYTFTHAAASGFEADTQYRVTLK